MKGQTCKGCNMAQHGDDVRLSSVTSSIKTIEHFALEYTIISSTSCRRRCVCDEPTASTFFAIQSNHVSCIVKASNQWRDVYQPPFTARLIQDHPIRRRRFFSMMFDCQHALLPMLHFSSHRKTPQFHTSKAIVFREASKPMGGAR